MNKLYLFLSFIALFLTTVDYSSAQAVHGVYSCKLKMEEKGTYIYNDTGEKQFNLTVDKNSKINITMDVEVREAKTQSTNYIQFVSTATGTVDANGALSASGPFTFNIFERDKMDTQWSLTAIYMGSFTNNAGIAEVSGTIKVQQGQEGEVAFSFNGSLMAEPGIKLLFPLGESPKVLDKGWKFAASAIVKTSGGMLDVAEKVEWSGSADFSPAIGKESSPSFHKLGTNKIKLYVKLSDGSELSEEFDIEVVDSKLYATLGCYAVCQADAHMCPVCPHSVVGVLSVGENEVLINGQPIITAPYTGVQSGCCGPNTFTVPTGDPNVLIHGRSAVLLGSVSNHCGGQGKILRAQEVAFPILSFNQDVTVMGKVSGVYIGKELNDYKGSNDGSTFTTGAAGAVSIGLGPGQMLSAGPNTEFKVEKNAEGKTIVNVRKGFIKYAGHSAGPGNLIINLEKETIIPMGTHFVAEIGSQETIFTLLEGKVDYTFLNSGETISLEAGEKIVTNTQGVVERLKADPSEVEKLWSGFATAAGKTSLANFNTETLSISDRFITFLTTNWMLAAAGIGAAFLLLFLIIFVRRRRKHKQLPKQNPNPKIVNSQVATNEMPHYGAATSTKFCPACGNSLLPTSRFCGKCGIKIN